MKVNKWINGKIKFIPPRACVRPQPITGVYQFSRFITGFQRNELAKTMAISIPFKLRNGLQAWMMLLIMCA